MGFSPLATQAAHVIWSENNWEAVWSSGRGGGWSGQWQRSRDGRGLNQGRGYGDGEEGPGLRTVSKAESMDAEGRANVTDHFEVSGH